MSGRAHVAFAQPPRPRLLDDEATAEAIPRLASPCGHYDRILETNVVQPTTVALRSH